MYFTDDLSLKHMRRGKRFMLTLGVFVLMTVMLCSQAKALTYQDYPYYQPAGIYVTDAWNFYQCECTSYVAWCLNNRNEISFYNWLKPGTDERLPTSIAGQDTDGTWYYGRWGHANNWKNAAEQCGYTVDSTPAVGAVYWIWNGSYTSTGHVAWVSAVNGNQVTIEQYNAGWDHKYSSETFAAGSRGEKYIHIKDINAEVRGSEMSQGYDRAIPDGDYLIAAAGTEDKTTFFYLDIEGSARPAANATNVSLCGPLSGNPPIYEIWTVTYNSSDGFYTIAQKGTNMCLDVYGGETLSGANVSVYGGNESSAQKWAISRNGRNGYRIQAKCSGFSLDIAGGGMNTNGTNVQQYGNNDSDAQSWLFIPYQPSQPIADGRYILLFTEDTGYEIDVPGDTGEIANHTNIHLWTDTAPSEFNSFDVIALSNGYYKIRHHASGKCLDVSEGLAKYKANVALFEDNDSITQQWAIVKNGTGYSLVSRCNGYMLDLPDGVTGQGKNVEVYPWLVNNKNQRWSFVHAEYRIHYMVSEGENTPEEQTKYYKTDLTLSSQVPTRDGYEFVCWEDILSLDENLNTDKYYPGDIYSLDESMELYPVWKQMRYDYTITYDANGGTGAPAAQHVTTQTATLSGVRPSRAHYTFMGWASGRNAEAADYQPGDTYRGGSSVTLYAVWKRNLEHLLVLPSVLTEIDREAFQGVAADAVVVPESVVSIGADAFDDVVIYGYSGSYAQTYAKAHNLTFIPITNQWVTEDAMPAGAHITDEKWTYTLTTTDTTTSTASSLAGWTQTGFEWQKTGTGSWKYASYPSGFDTGSSLYNKYNKSALTSGETVTGDNTKRVVDSGSAFVTYIYWHWTFTDSLNSTSDNHNVLVEDGKKYNVATGSVTRDYIYFDAFEDTVDHGTWGPGTNGQINVDPMRYAWRDDLGDVSHWWWIFEVRQQTYTDYQKLFTYVKDESEILESSTEVTPADGVTNIQHWVKYGF